MNKIKLFLSDSDLLDHMVLRPLSHISLAWELTWDADEEEYEREDGSLSGLLNDLITSLAAIEPRKDYHDSEDRICEFVKTNNNWPIRKEGRRWIGAEYEWILEQGGFDDLDLANLKQAAAGRIVRALEFGQKHFDEMEDSHRKILAAILTSLVYHEMSSLDGFP